MFENPEKGTIKWIDPRGRGFGSLRWEKAGRDIFFHKNDCVIFSPPWREITWRLGKEKEPELGDCVVFEVGHNEVGVTATLWGYRENYEVARFATTRSIEYRVVRETQFSHRDALYVVTVWEGTDLRELAQQHPRTIRTDDLRDSQYSNFKSRYHFEAEIAGKWEPMHDPRPLGSLTYVG